MKLLRHGAVGQERPGAMDAQGRIRDLSLLVPDFTPEWMAPEKLAALTAIDLNRMPLVAAGALGMKPPKFLSRGAVMQLSGGILGTQRQRVV